jgi:hypothetical protein
LIYLGFITEGKIAAVFITPSLGVPNWPVIYIINTAPPASNLESNTWSLSILYGRFLHIKFDENISP